MVHDGYMDYVFEISIQPKRVEQVQGHANTYIVRNDLYFSRYKYRKIWCGPFEDFDENKQGRTNHNGKSRCRHHNGRNRGQYDDLADEFENLHF